VSGIQYWVSDYFTEVLGVSVADTHIAFAIICITAPIFGAILSGYIGSKLGGYKGQYTLPSVILAGIITSICGIIIPEVDNFLIFSVIIWIMLFCGGYILPIMTGIMLTTIESNEKNQANSLANFSYNLLGYFPAPAIYGVICQYTGGRKSKWGMTF
jgi:sugar phosphate permease